MKNSTYIHYDNQPRRPRRRKKRNSGVLILTVVLCVLILALIGVGGYNLFFNNSTPNSTTTSGGTATTPLDPNSPIVVVTSTPTPASTRAAYQNFSLFPGTAQMNVPIGQPEAGLLPADRNVTQTIFSGEKGDQVLESYERNPPVFFADPVDFQAVPGILTFRGNNFRNAAAWGSVQVKEGVLEQAWEFNQIGTMKSSSWDFSWSGTGWTGQPLSVQWDWDVQQMMNLYPDKKAKQGLVEVIIGTMDGNVYFFDLDDGTKTRDPIFVGASIKGTPSIDPRGYPLLYVGQGDANEANKKMGYRIFSLIDSALIFFQDSNDSRSYRPNWYACDSSPIINAATDTLFYPNENGMIYTSKLNTNFDKAAGTISVAPEKVDYRYIAEGVATENVGVESSMSVYDHYGYFCDNAGNLVCLDLNTLQMIWNRPLDDDSDVSPVLEEENGHVYLYVGTEVDWQRSDTLDYMGAAYTYKIDAMTGATVWETSQSCYTHNGVDKGDDVNGGMLGNPIVGKKSISDLVIFAYSMTDALYSGNLIVAYNKDTGDQVWSYHMNKYSWSSPVDCYDEEGNAYIVMCDSFGQVHLIDGKTGTRITYLQTLRNKGTANEANGGNMESSPMVFNNTIVIGSRAGSIYGVKIK